MQELLTLSPRYQDLSTLQWIVAIIGSIGIGISKAGIKGSGIFFITLIAIFFGAKESTGLILPLLITADIFAVLYYKRHTDWKLLLRFIPWIVAGVLLGVWLGKDMPEEIFKQIMAVIIIVSIAIMFYWEFRKVERVPSEWWFAGGMGITAGFTTMIGNLAGAFTNIFFLAMRVSKIKFIGTVAMLYLIINLFKLPFHIWTWETISTESLTFNLRLIPAVLVGIWIGIKLVKVINEKAFRQMILILTAIGAVLIFLK